MKVYVVTSGSYSDYGINAIFSTKELAEEYIKEVWKNSTSCNGVNEWELDTDDPNKFKDKKFFQIKMNFEGDVKEIIKGDFNDWLDRVGEESDYYETFNTNLGICTCWAKDIDTAIKITNDLRAQYIANGQREGDIETLKKQIEAFNLKCDKEEQK